MDGLSIAVLIGVLLLIGGWAAGRIRVPAPLVLLVLGIAAGFVPLFGSIQLPHELVLQLFLPALLYWEALNVSRREIRRNLRVIVLQAVPLVLATVAVVAVVGHAAALPWAVAITLGAVVAPTDATAIASVAGDLPRRTRTILRAESLINDGTALAVYAVALAAVAGGRDVDFGTGTLLFLASYAGGIAIGLIGALAVRGARRLTRANPLLENTVSLLTPFAVYLPAEALHVSGVIAVVTCGIALSRTGPRLVGARTRTQANAFWQLTTFVLNGTLFLLVGFQAHRVVQELGGRPLTVVLLGLAVSAAVIGTRIVWGLTVPYVIRALDRRPVQRAMRVPLRQRSVTAWAGFRGAVSLAAALALPVDGVAARADLIAGTLIVILVTLLVQGVTMPAVVRWARLPADPTEADEERLAQQRGAAAALEEIPRAAARLGVPDEVRDQVEREYRDGMDRLATEGPPSARMVGAGSEGALRRAMVAAKREAVIGLRDAGDIDDTVLRRVQERLDIEELRLTPSVARD